MSNMKHLDYIQNVADEDISHLREKEKTYKGSWKKSGGRSAWFMIQRKIDRLLNMMARPKEPEGWKLPERSAVVFNHYEYEHLEYLIDCYVAENIFAKIQENASGSDGTVLAEIRDLRRYLLLVEAEMMARNVILSTIMPFQEACDEMMQESNYPGTPEDGGHHVQQEHGDDELQYHSPWVVKTIPDKWKAVYITLHRDLHILPAYLEPEVHKWVFSFKTSFNELMQLKYVPVSDHSNLYWILDIDQVPKSERDRWPKLYRELNNKEHESIEPWQQVLYEWHNSISKWIIGSKYIGWTHNT